MIISVIIPTYNKSMYLDLTLSSFINQNFNEYELIIIDDGSTDNTKDIVSSYESKLNIKYIYQQNKGRSAARNSGLREAVGKYVVFNDDDRIVHPSFLSEHLKEHMTGDNKIVIGWKHNILTFLQPGIVFRQNELVQILANNPELSKELLQGSSINLVKKEMIERFHTPEFEKYIVWNGYDNFPAIINKYGDQLEGFYFPWILGTTANLSVSRELLDSVGHFDENFIGWGMEDTDLSYRLFRAGGEMKINRMAYNFHQYHLRENPKQIAPALRKNTLYFCEKYKELACYLYYRCWNLGKIEISTANELMRFANENNNVLSELRELYSIQQS
ncbi:glycosyltransferase [Paenibacillus aceti]|uniref:Glycosyl transferase n=1 Tax=Paenibacillus aceti TaxID=1820010 RepID=A0ABQ1W7F3_9BACL|nr:glycosyltransferase [Paenibacillus aceti]GGG18937.1 glycosyl transferase [Paenibacillus aceti]